jgi:ribosomal protein L37AE/L43A
MTTACPLCHTPSPTITAAERLSGGAWQCARCGHHWDEVRLATAAAYAVYDATHPAPVAGTNR